MNCSTLHSGERASVVRFGEVTAATRSQKAACLIALPEATWIVTIIAGQKPWRLRQEEISASAP